MSKRISVLLWVCGFTWSLAVRADAVLEAPLGEPVERHLSDAQPLTPWAHDPSLLENEAGDRLETRQVAGEKLETVKLTGVVPPIHFESGVADIPAGYVERLGKVLEGMRDRRNVRLHFVGHADSQPLSDALTKVYGDNSGLSRERAGEVAEFFKLALGLPPEAIAFEWAGDTQPIASNATAAGRAQNRRVEVEVWYDKPVESVRDEEVLVTEDFKRVKVCRVETVCKMRYQEGHERRARVRNLVAPLRYEDETVNVSEDFARQVRQALANLHNKQNVHVRFIGFTDDAPLTGRNANIYGNQLSLSKARAHRVALAVQDALKLPSSIVESDGRGATLPLGSNETAQGRALNRRVEVEFWYDDPLQNLPDEPQLCPADAGDRTVTKVYDPPWGTIQPLELEGGRAVIPPGYTESLRRAMNDVNGRTNVRLQFIGYTANERLDRRTAMVYGDDIGLSAARARRAMDDVTRQMGLADTQAEHEGRGFVQSDDVVNVGFTPGEKSYVRVQVVYDELAPVDDYEGVDITRLTRELHPKSPYELNLMRITVDGEPIDDPGRSSADIQRCTDVALDNAKVELTFDNLESRPRLSVAAHPSTVEFVDDSNGSLAGTPVRFRMYANYAAFIDHAEVRILEQGRSVQSAPLQVLAIDRAGFAEWQPEAGRFPAPVHELQYVLRAYDAKGNFDETAPQPLWMIYRPTDKSEPADESERPAADPAQQADESKQPPDEPAQQADQSEQQAGESEQQGDESVQPADEQQGSETEQVSRSARQTADGDRQLLAAYGESELAIRTSRWAAARSRCAAVVCPRVTPSGLQASRYRWMGSATSQPRRSCRPVRSRLRSRCSTTRAAAQSSCATSSSSARTGSTSVSRT
jgi:flagellar motor protein MotB